jgi:hypothetical protein
MRIRQIALAAKDLEHARREIESAFRPGEPFQDPGVETFGLNNWVFPVGRTFLEVVSPVEDGTSAGRYLEKRGGDGGYMVIVQVPELESVRTRMKDLGVRIVFEIAFDDIATVHLHPKDTGGVLLSIDCANPPETWRWGGPNWHERARAERVETIAGVEIDCRRPQETAARWGEILDLPVAGDDPPTIRCPGDGSEIRFTACEDGSPEGIRRIHLSCNDVEAVLDATDTRPSADTPPVVSLLGTQFELHSK